MTARATWRCPDCGHPMPIEFEIQGLTVTGDGQEFRNRFVRHIMLNPDVHPTFVLAGNE